MVKKWWFQLIVLLILLGTSRLFWLDRVPLHLTQDEVAVGYSAYSILKTGGDEWGEKMPLQFRSVGDYKQPVLIYLVAATEGVLGMRGLAVRLPSAVFSILTVLLFWWFSRKIFKEERSGWAFLGAVLMTLSPWHIRPSRMSHDAVIALFFVLAYFVFWILWIEKRRLRDFVLMGGMGLLAMMTYHSAKLFVPMLGIVLAGMFGKEILVFWNEGKKKKSWWVGVGVLVLMGLWVFFNFVIGKAAARGQMTILTKDFEYARILSGVVMGLRGEGLLRIWLLLGFLFKRYLEYFSPSFYALERLGLTLSDQPSQGVLLGAEVVILLIGLLDLISGKEGLLRKKWLRKVILAYFLLGLLPAALANNSKHPYRTGLMIPVVYLLISMGWWRVYQWVKKGKYKWIVLILAIGSYGWGVARFADYYLIHYPVQLSEYRMYPWMEVAKYVTSVRGNYERVVVDPRFGTNGPYIVGVPHYYMLFAEGYDPKKFLERKVGAWDNVNYENFEFRDFSWQIEDKKGVLYVASDWSFRTVDGIAQEQILGKFSFKNGKGGIWVVEGAREK